MQDSILPTSWGSSPFDEQDLDALLAANTSPSESTSAVPPALRQVADTLAALRAAPSPAELRGEAAIRAEFRARAEFAPAMVTPFGGPGRGRHGTPRRGRGTRGRGRGTPGRGGRVPAHARRGGLAAAVFAAASVVIAVAAAYSGNLPGPAQRLAHVALAAPSARQSGATTGASPSMDVRSARAVVSPSRPAAANSASPGPAVSPSAVETPAANPASLCEALSLSLEDPSFGRPWWETPAYKQVSVAAGGAARVPEYCAAEWAKLRPHDYPQVPVTPGSGNRPSGNPPSGSQPSGNPPSGNQAPGSGASGNQGSIPGHLPGQG
ncbi:MAG TPA: hypothetical protein VG142_14615 [Trebonia sp.]|nr:hypothetical protein [Trebonia sp.]